MISYPSSTFFTSITFVFSYIFPFLSSILFANPCAYRQGLNCAWFLNLTAPNTFFEY